MSQCNSPGPCTNVEERGNGKPEYCLDRPFPVVSVESGVLDSSVLTC